MSQHPQGLRASTQALVTRSVILIVTCAATLVLLPAHVAMAAPRVPTRPHSVALDRFVHTATAANTTANTTSLDELPHDQNLVINVTPTWNTNDTCGCVFDSAPLGVWWNGSTWAIFHEDSTPIGLGATFNVSAEIARDGLHDLFFHVATSANSVGNYTILDDPALNGNPNAIVIVTQNWNPAGVCACRYNPRYIGVWYTGSHWAIFNEDATPMPVGAGFNVAVWNDAATTAPALGNSPVDMFTISNFGGLDTDGRPDLLLLVTHNFNSRGMCNCVDNNHPSGVDYYSTTGKWSVWNEDLAAVSAGAVFNVLMLETLS